jgi:molybdenum cofactor synthesis domain-containing protein
MKPFTELLSFEGALATALENIGPTTTTEVVGLDESVDRVVSKDVVADEEVPRFDRSAMDGYAVIAEDTFGASHEAPRELKLVATLQVADLSTRLLERGECAQVATGSPLPPGADAVVMVEYTGLKDGNVEIHKPIHPAGNVSKRGEDIAKGRKLLSIGDLVTPSRIGALAALGVTQVEVFRRPRVAVVPTGDEIVEVGSPPGEGQIYDINSHTVAALVRKNGGTPDVWPPVPDSREALSKALTDALGYDILIFSGGSSVGERDLLNEIFAAKGKVLFHGVQIKPGKPTLFAVIDRKPVFSMPGHPTSCLCSAYMFVAPALRKLARLPPRQEGHTRARITRRLVCTLGRKQFITVRLEDDMAVPTFKESSAITSMSAADGYLVVPENVELIAEGQEVDVTLFSI